MIKGRQHFRFTLEPAHPMGIARELIGKNLDRDFALPLRVARAIDLAHAALSWQRRDLIGAELRADSDRHRECHG